MGTRLEDVFEVNLTKIGEIEFGLYLQYIQLLYRQFFSTKYSINLEFITSTFSTEILEPLLALPIDFAAYLWLIFPP